MRGYTRRGIAAGRQPGVWRSLREGFRKLPDYPWTLVRGLLVVLALAITVIGIPWAVNRFVRWMFGEYAAVLEGIRGKAALDQSAAAVKGHWWQTAANWGVLSFLGAAPGIIVALLLMVLARLPLDAANSVASLVYALAQPFAVAGFALLYLRWRGRHFVQGVKGVSLRHPLVTRPPANTPPDPARGFPHR